MEDQQNVTRETWWVENELARRKWMRDVAAVIIAAVLLLWIGAVIILFNRDEYSLAIGLMATPATWVAGILGFYYGSSESGTQADPPSE